MVKTIFKELIILLLLILAIILVLGVLFYDYVPMSKTLPLEVEYISNEEVKALTSTSGSVDEETVIMTYSVDSTDLNNYQRSQDYVPGKANPFSGFKKEENVDGEGNTTTESETGNTTPNTNSGKTENNNDNNEDDNNGDAPGKFYDENVK